MRTEHQQRVDAMTEKIRSLNNLPSVPDKPTQNVNRAMIIAQAKLIYEEVYELFDALGVQIIEEPFLGGIYLEFIDDNATIDLPHVAKELADVSVVVTGMFSEFGISDDAVLTAVDENNLDKFGPGGYLDENRKWRKPPNHPKPDMAKVLKEQGWTGDETNTENLPISN